MTTGGISEGRVGTAGTIAQSEGGSSKSLRPVEKAAPRPLFLSMRFLGWKVAKRQEHEIEVVPICNDQLTTDILLKFQADALADALIDGGFFVIEARVEVYMSEQLHFLPDFNGGARLSSDHPLMNLFFR